VKFKTWALKHDRALTVAGSIILLSAFVAKEVLREHWKERLDELADGQRMYTMNNEFTDSYMTRQEMLDEIRAIAETIGVHKFDPASGVSSIQQLTYSDVEAARDDNMIDQLSAWRNHLADMKSVLNNSDSIHEADEALDKVTKDIEADQRLLGKLALSMSKTMESQQREAIKNLQRDRDELEYHLANRTGGDIRVASRVILEQADLELKRSKSSYVLWSDVSYAVFGVGWSMTLIGKLFNIEELKVNA